ncbi:class III poly(R)-hydroxyalkanoic acid synthase subunit PhaE [Lysobacter arenosi]|jgi:class III poly(R)-hydroxyalkanoic acid synthase PhaE subunit|uniref:Poly(3-hydroxyalkanoate) polymerase subunit PhaE n=1 Tax=Lysobacter arenosi TaxID=2795387 RepID=A0ABX7RBQ1_9GAMM|nr:class III poly(R)-hydroxyalkanoic acid synthase subunit PhaE [Lysobacter arenosi]QSX75579.1 class III poly(R)-hydroxyalkanoic acid synthase subunit PhaE [Lysobacter arenosi]
MKQDDFEAWTRQYWNAWGDSLRSATTPEAPTMPGVPGWSEAMNWWSQLAKGGMPQGDEAVSRFNAQAQGWFGQMQQLAAQFAGRTANAGDIAAAWKQALGGDGANPFAHMLGTMPGSASTDPSQWFDQAAPWLQQLQRDGRSWLGLPAFGFAREHQERWQHLMQAQVDLQQQSQAYQTLLAEAGQDAFVRFERKLGERSAPGRQLESVRALFDLWIDAAEEAYADIALSPRFRDAYAALVNAQMTLRGRQQTIVEQASAQMGMPTRTELDSAHRKIVQLERELRRLRDAVQANAARSGRSEAPRQAADEPAPEPAPRPAPKTRKAAPAGSAAKPARGAAKPSTRKR